MTLPRMKIKAPVPFPATVAGSGGIAVSKSNGVWTIAPDFTQLASVLASAVADPTSKEIWIWDPVTDAYNVLTLAGLGQALFQMTSTTSVTIGAGSQTFATQSGKDVGVGSWVLATSSAAPTVNYMLGQVTAYAGTSLTIAVTANGIGGSGTHADWTIQLSSPAGSQGRSAGFAYQWSSGTGGGDPTPAHVAANSAAFASITALAISKTDADGNALGAELATWGAGTSSVFGRLKIYDPLVPTSFMTFDVTALADGGTYDTLTVTPVAQGGAFIASQAVRASFTAKGDKGTPGTPGTPGAA